MAELPPLALSIRQPWAFSIVHGGKDIENRQWPTRYRGPLLIHAAKGMTRDELDDWKDFIAERNLDGPWRDGKTVGDLQRGGIVGACDLVDCITQSDSPWFVGRFGFVLRNVRPLPFMPCRGALGFFKPELS